MDPNLEATLCLFGVNDSVIVLLCVSRFHLHHTRGHISSFYCTEVCFYATAEEITLHSCSALQSDQELPRCLDKDSAQSLHTQHCFRQEFD